MNTLFIFIYLSLSVSLSLFAGRVDGVFQVQL